MWPYKTFGHTRGTNATSESKKENCNNQRDLKRFFAFKVTTK